MSDQQSEGDDKLEKKIAAAQSTSQDLEAKPATASAAADSKPATATATTASIVKPKRPLSAYNMFFKSERERILAEAPTRPQGKPRRSHGKIGFADLARQIATRWKTIEPERLEHYNNLSNTDKERYKEEMKIWRKAQSEIKAAVANKGEENTSTISSTARLQRSQSREADDNVQFSPYIGQPRASLREDADMSYPSHAYHMRQQQEHNDMLGLNSPPDLYGTFSRHLGSLDVTNTAPAQSGIDTPLDHNYNDRYTTTTTTTYTGQPIQQEDFSTKRAIAELASNIGDDCVDFLISIFGTRQV